MRTTEVTLKRARRLRRSMTGQEVGLWVRLRNRQLGGYRFRRQHPMGPYILDFYCAEVRLAVEIDGYSHGVEGCPAHDERRDAWLLEQGVRTLRISAEAAREPQVAADTVLAALRALAPSVTS